MSVTWQEICTAELKRHIDMGVTGEAAWGVRRWELFEKAQREQGPAGRIIIADLDASGDRLRRYSFFSCYLTRCGAVAANPEQLSPDEACTVIAYLKYPKPEDDWPKWTAKHSSRSSRLMGLYEARGRDRPRTPLEQPSLA